MTALRLNRSRRTPIAPLSLLVAPLLLLGAPLLLGGCATSHGLDDSEVASDSAAHANVDPLEPMNRGIFAFNEALDRYALDPLATGWDFVVPKAVQTGIDNFYTHLNMPIVLANDLLQLKLVAVIEDVARITHNTAFGLLGFIDVATMVGIPENDEDFGQTMGSYGVPAGPYLMVPILGPYTLRDGVGEIVDTTASGFLYGMFWQDGSAFPDNGLSTSQTTGVSIGQKGLELLNLRTIFDEELEESKKDAFDYYIFVRNAYLQNRRAKVADQSDIPVLDEADLYFFDDEEEEEENYDEF